MNNFENKLLNTPLKDILLKEKIFGFGPRAIGGLFLCLFGCMKK